MAADSDVPGQLAAMTSAEAGGRGARTSTEPLGFRLTAQSFGVDGRGDKSRRRKGGLAPPQQAQRDIPQVSVPH
jgi:hypothetical protein